MGNVIRRDVLLQVQIVMRHGDRTPLETLISPVWRDSDEWKCEAYRISSFKRRHSSQSHPFISDRCAYLSNSFMEWKS